MRWGELYEHTMEVPKFTFDARTFIHCACGQWVQECFTLEPSNTDETNARCKHRDDLIHFTIGRIDYVNVLD